jgi:hypothetical protein
MGSMEEEIIQYGGSSTLLTACPRCNRSPDQHKLANIRPSEETTRVVNKFATLLTEYVLRLHEIQQMTREEMMIGALTAQIGGKTIKWVANSGPNVLTASHIDKEWQVIHDMPAELGDDACYGVGGQAFLPTLPDTVSRTQCAAPKLLCTLLKMAGPRAIRQVCMTELWWKNPVTKSETPNRNWNQLKPVPSCDNCKTFVPQMLCDRAEMGMEGFTPQQVLPLGTQRHDVMCSQGHRFSLAIPDDAWRAYGTNVDGVKSHCPQCHKEVPCHDPQRPKTTEMACPYCDKLFRPTQAVVKDKDSFVTCPHCEEMGKYRKVEVMNGEHRETIIKSKKLGKK